VEGGVAQQKGASRLEVAIRFQQFLVDEDEDVAIS
jgi:hypothetical protein